MKRLVRRSRPNHAPTTACTTGAHAIGDAANLIWLGQADMMLAGATEASVHELALAGFGRAQVSPSLPLSLSPSLPPSLSLSLSLSPPLCW